MVTYDPLIRLIADQHVLAAAVARQRTADSAFRGTQRHLTAPPPQWVGAAIRQAGLGVVVLVRVVGGRWLRPATLEG